MRQRAVGGESLDILSMHERATLIGGALAIESRIGGGTIIVATVPLPRSAS